MRGVNKATILGTMGSDPEIRTVGDTQVVNVSLATNEKWKDKATGEDKERTEWHRIEIWGRPAEIVKQYCTKGSKLYVEGKIQTDKYQDKETGADRYSTKIVSRDVQLVGGGSRVDEPQAF